MNGVRKPLKQGKKSGDKTLLATAVYHLRGNAVLFLKDHPRINQLLDTGMRLSQAEL